MCKSDLDNLVTSKVRSNRSVLATLANNISLVGLLSVHAHAVLVREDGNSLERQLVGGTEDADGDFAAVGYKDLLEVHDAAVGAQTRVHGVGGGVSLAVGVWSAILVVVGSVGHDGGPVACRVVRHGCGCLCVCSVTAVSRLGWIVQSSPAQCLGWSTKMANGSPLVYTDEGEVGVIWKRGRRGFVYGTGGREGGGAESSGGRV
jgi:hypothetical protein